MNTPDLDSFRKHDDGGCYANEDKVSAWLFYGMVASLIVAAGVICVATWYLMPYMMGVK